jgi:AraC-like DNA-binding protein
MGIHYSVAVAKIYPVLEFFKSLALDPQDILRSCGLDLEVFAHPDERISSDTFHQLANLAVQASGDVHFGLHAGEYLKHFPNILGYVLANCRTLGEALDKFCTFQQISDGVYHTELNRDNGLVIIKTGSVVLEDPDMERHMACAHLSGQVAYAKALLGGNYHSVRPQHVYFVHAKTTDVTEYARIFNCPVSFSKQINALILDEHTLDLPIAYPNPDLLIFFEQHAALSLKNLLAGETLTARVNRLLVRALPDGDAPRIESIAQQLNMSVRSLQNKLKKENSSFSVLLDTVRKEIAMSYLKDRQVSIGEISYALGFAEPSVFHRRFKNWTSLTPAQFREQAVTAQKSKTA